MGDGVGSEAGSMRRFAVVAKQLAEMLVVKQGAAS
jgi:hypothetical protein